MSRLISNSAARFLPAGQGAVATTVEAKLRESKSLLDFMDEPLKQAVASGVYTNAIRDAMFLALSEAWDSALDTPHDLYAPSGRYELREKSFPWRQSVLTVEALQDCRDVTLYCEGPGTVFATVSSTGADVFQLNGLKNFHVRGYPTLTATITATEESGSNGCSVTGGYDNLTLQITPVDCPGVDKGTTVDGGKGFTIQCDNATEEVGTLVASVRAKQCFQGFGFEASLVGFLDKKVAIDVDLIAEDCFVACAVGAAEASGPIPQGTHIGVRVVGQAINCQKDVQLGRAYGAMIDIRTITTKSEAARRLDPRGVPWNATDDIVEALQCTYAKNSRISIFGNKGTCAYKARIGGAPGGASGQTGSTEHCDFFIDVGGVASVEAVHAVDFGGNVMNHCRLQVTKTTAETLPAEFYSLNLQNMLAIGPTSRLIGARLDGRTTFSVGGNGNVAFAAVDQFNGVPGLQGLIGSAPGVLVTGLFDYDGKIGVGVKNGGRPWLPDTLPVISDNFTAKQGGYVPGDVYRTPGGYLMVVY